MQILKILVTGGTGFIGSHLCEALIERGHHVTLLVRPDDDTRWVDALPLARAIGDVTDKGSLAAAVRDVDCVFHLAAVLGAPDPQIYFRVNGDGTRNLAQSMAIGWLRRRRPFLHLRNVAYLRHRYWRVDTLKAERDFGYITRHRLADGLTLTARWYADQGLL